MSELAQRWHAFVTSLRCSVYRRGSAGDEQPRPDRTYLFVTPWPHDDLEAARGRTEHRARSANGWLAARYPPVPRRVLASALASSRREAQAMAAVLAAGPGAVLAHLSAAALFKTSRFAAPIPHVIVPRRHRPIEGIVHPRVSRALDPLDVTVLSGHPGDDRGADAGRSQRRADEVAARERHARGGVSQAAGSRLVVAGDRARERAPQPSRPRSGDRAASRRQRGDQEPAGGRVPRVDRGASRAAGEHAPRGRGGRLPLAGAEACRRGRRPRPRATGARKDDARRDAKLRALGYTVALHSTSRSSGGPTRS